MRSYNVRFSALKARQNFSFAANESFANVNSVINGEVLDMKMSLFASVVESL